MGLLNSLFPQTMQGTAFGGDNNWLDRNKGLLMSAGLGLMSGGGQAGLLGALQGMELDKDSAKEAQRQSLINQYASQLPAADKQMFMLDPSAYLSAQMKSRYEKQAPYSDQGKIAADLRAGLITQEQAQQAMQGGNEYGMTPIYGVGADGKPAVLQLSKSGKATAAQLPQGFSIAKDPIRVDTETGTAILDPQTRQQIGFIPKDIQGAKSMAAQGTAQGEAIAGFPKAQSSAETLIGNIKSLKNDPNLTRVIGSLDGLTPNFSGSSNAAQAKIDQLKGSAFLSAFESLKGGGQITEMEGAKATDALARLQNQRQDEASYLQALNDFETEVMRLTNLAAQRAGRPPIYKIDEKPQAQKRLRYNPNTGNLE